MLYTRTYACIAHTHTHPHAPQTLCVQDIFYVVEREDGIEDGLLELDIDIEPMKEPSKVCSRSLGTVYICPCFSLGVV